MRAALLDIKFISEFGSYIIIVYEDKSDVHQYEADT